ncbi:type II toxin-antitoxin system Phd/YefM family antitoxin [Neptunomonas phycophila]|uniref:type II toxin-antitoxin system Phd/YefM family antitoxin n=1 Tax=Neptunomonas phycophila TaxID=1572645 RepID=UPI0015BF4BF3|nr:type II toxin-antitoxin system Phd/YefM family antitoxin [Neptunomonas phycophila]QLE96563.1 type II toxin-antitoxin system Phd/YefM family antitoxin [Neptunomonas phycophila]
MSMADHIKPISYLKANAAKIAQELKDDGEPYFITQNGEAAMVVQSVAEYERKENTLAMLQLISQAEQDIQAGRTSPMDEALLDIRSKLGLL